MAAPLPESGVKASDGAVDKLALTNRDVTGEERTVTRGEPLPPTPERGHGLHLGRSDQAQIAAPGRKRLPVQRHDGQPNPFP